MPKGFQVDWVKRFVKIERRTGESPTLRDLHASINGYIDENSHPNVTHFVDSLVKRSARVLKTEVHPSAGQEAGQSNGPEQFAVTRCLYHGTPGHSLNNCVQFSNLNWQEKRDFAFEHRLCYLCLQSHLAKNCPRIAVCTLCRGHHTSAMHRDFFLPDGRNTTNSYDHGGNMPPSRPSPLFVK